MGAPPLTFEVASVKLAAPDEAQPGDMVRNMDSSPGHFAMRNVSLRFCIEWAYDLKDYQVEGPDWIKSEMRYDIVATAPGASDNDMRPMLQALLTDRFQLKVHRQTRNLDIYALLPGKGSPKVTQAGPDEQTRNECQRHRREVHKATNFPIHFHADTTYGPPCDRYDGSQRDV